jgi:hypothetical protein
MSAPTSNKMNHPLLIEPQIRRRFFVGYIIQIWFSLLPAVFIGVIFWNLWMQIAIWINVLLILPEILILYYATIITSLILMKIILSVLNLLHKPQEGIFPRDLKNKDYKYYNLRNYARHFHGFDVNCTTKHLISKLEKSLSI